MNQYYNKLPDEAKRLKAISGDHMSMKQRSDEIIALCRDNHVLLHDQISQDKLTFTIVDFDKFEKI